MYGIAYGGLGYLSFNLGWDVQHSDCGSVARKELEESWISVPWSCGLSVSGRRNVAGVLLRGHSNKRYWDAAGFWCFPVKRWKKSLDCVVRAGLGRDGGNGVDDYVVVRGVSYRPPGTESILLDNVSFSLPQKSLGLVFGPSGSGKTTLLQVLSGLAKPSAGSIVVGRDSFDYNKKPSFQGSLSSRVGIVFQFPERYFLSDSILEELLFGWPRQTQDLFLRQTLTMRLQTAVYAVGLSGIPLDTNPRALSDGYKRRLALAVQLVRMPDILLLDEPLAGLDWMARAEVVTLLTTLKREQTVIVVSHDLKELTPLADKAWRMEMGGRLVEEQPTQLIL